MSERKEDLFPGSKIIFASEALAIILERELTQSRAALDNLVDQVARVVAERDEARAALLEALHEEKRWEAIAHGEAGVKTCNPS